MSSSNPEMSRITDSNRSYDVEQAYDSSPVINAAHWAADIDPVPESVSRSMVTCDAGTRNRLCPALVSARSRSVLVGKGIDSTALIRYGSIRTLLTRRTEAWGRPEAGCHANGGASRTLMAADLERLIRRPVTWAVFPSLH